MFQITKITVQILIILFHVTLLSLSAGAAPSDSFAKFSVKLSPAGGFVGNSTEVKGNAVKGPDGTVSAQNITVNLSRLKTGMNLRDEHTKKYLETTNFPEAILLSAQGKNGKGTGQIKIKGIEKTIQGTYVIQENTLQAKFPLKLSEFNIKGIRYMGVGVKDEIQVEISVPLKTGP